MIKITASTIATLVLLATPAVADRDAGGDWLSKAFSAPAASKSGGTSGKSKASSATSSYSSGGGSSAGSGIASYYWQPQKVASGGTFNPNALTAAHKTLPFGTRVRVTSSNGRSVDVVINDRGPFVKGRVIDLSRRAAQEIGMTGAGLANVSLQVL